jgi:hypothetical protein
MPFARQPDGELGVTAWRQTHSCQNFTTWLLFRGRQDGFRPRQHKVIPLADLARISPADQCSVWQGYDDDGKRWR